MTETKPTSFDAIIQQEGGFTFVTIPFSPREAWGAKPRYHITGSIQGVAVRGALEESEQGYLLRLGPAWMRDSRIEIGATVTVQLALEGPHAGNLAPDIATALSGSATAQAFFEGLPTFYRKNFIRWIESAKKEETRAKRINDMLKLLEEGKREKQ